MPAPANDNFANAQVLTGARGTVTGSNVGATFQVGEPPANDGGEGDDGDVTVWYRWVATGAGSTTIDTFGSSFDTVLHVYTGSALGALSLIAANDDSGAPPPNASQSRVTFTAVLGTTYQIRVNGYSTTGGSTDYGSIVLHWSGVLAPPTDGVMVVGEDGGPYGIVANARIARVSWELNGIGAAEISLATTDPDAPLMVPGREVQIYYQGELIWWGPIVRPQAGLRETTWQCAGLLWYFSHRFMGRADRVNQLTNGDFESGETGWSFSGVTHSVNTDPAFIISGTKSEKLTGTSVAHNTYATQTYTHPAGGYPGGDFLTGSVWVWITNADYVGPALDEFGLVLRRRSAAGDPLDAQFETGKINDTTPRDQWVNLTVGIVNVVEGDLIDILLFPPHGVAYFDLATLTFMESLSFGYPPPAKDVTDIIATIVNYAQDHTPPGFTHGKSDLNIAALLIAGGGVATGVLHQIAYQFAEHRNILDAIMEYVRQGACDIDIAITSTTRTLTVYPKSTDSRTPKLGKGTLFGTTLELDVNVADFTWSWDLDQAASNVVLLGPGSGPDRPEGGAINTSFLGGAFTTEIVEQAPDNTTIGQLDDRAAERLAVAVQPEILQVTTLPGAGVIGDLLVGDTVPVDITDGWVDIDATYRVARIEADLVKDQATITLNAVPA